MHNQCTPLRIPIVSEYVNVSIRALHNSYCVRVSNGVPSGRCKYIQVKVYHRHRIHWFGTLRRLGRIRHSSHLLFLLLFLVFAAVIFGYDRSPHLDLDLCLVAVFFIPHEVAIRTTARSSLHAYPVSAAIPSIESAIGNVRHLPLPALRIGFGVVAAHEYHLTRSVEGVVGDFHRRHRHHGTRRGEIIDIRVEGRVYVVGDDVDADPLG
mmetsp:Transcript_23651/g.49544  ORF Transcript_23651/g.49544 Transcript_23651/m.49544 type:complete len:209 (+) Transcript_23651:2606-3232(+)